MNNDIKIKTFFECVDEIARLCDVKIYIVGGFVRDFLLYGDILNHDFDFVVEGDARSVARVFKEKFGGSLDIFDAFFTAKITNCEKFNGVKEIDFASSREEVYLKGGALPKVTYSLIEKDLKRRDFSINAMAILVSDLLHCIENNKIKKNELSKYIIDEFYGVHDLGIRQIRVLHDKSFFDDPTRIFRAFRYKARINGVFEERTKALLLEALKVDVLKTISKGRIEKELLKIRSEMMAKEIFDEMKDYKILDIE